MKMLDVKNAENALRKLAIADLPIKMAFGLSAFIDKIDNELNRFEKFRIDLITKLGTKDKNGNISVEEDSIDMFNAEMGELLNAEIDIKVKPIDVDDLISVEGLKLSIVELKALENIGLITM